jgi:transposase-like protein
MKCPLETQMDTAALTATTSTVRPGGVRCMRTNAEKVTIVEEVQQPGRSVAEVAREYGVNANLIFGWTRLHKRGLSGLPKLTSTLDQSERACQSP